VNAFFVTIQRLKSEQTKVTASINGAEPIEIPVEAFKDLYAELLITSFYGRADQTDITGGIVLTEQQMQELAAKGDDCSLKIEFYRSIGVDVVYRMYDYSATKTYTTINGSGCFYISKIMKNSIIDSAKTVANGERLQ
jgi:hypothetical protein